MCPQCLAEIDVDVDLFDDKAPKTQQKFNDSSRSSDTPPLYNGVRNNTSTSASHQPNTQEETFDSRDKVQQLNESGVDDVIRYCKQCGAFLKEGVNFCPKCGKYVRVSPPSFKPHQQMTEAQKAAAKIRATTTPVKRVPTNIQSKYKQPQDPTYQAMPARQGQHTTNSRFKASTSRRANSAKKNSWLSKFDILSVKGCLIASVVVVILFFIIYFILLTLYFVSSLFSSFF